MELPRKTIRFGPFELCPKSQEIWKHGVRIKLRRQPMAVLQILLEQSGEVVSREELQRRLWPSDTFVDFEHGLNTAVKELRGVLGDSATEPRYIETLPRVGYRMMVVAEEVIQGEGETRDSRGIPSSQEEKVAADVDINVDHKRRGTGLQWLVGAGLVVLMVVLGYYGYKRALNWKSLNGETATSGRIKLVVMPFENLTGDKGQDYFSEGLTEEMIAQLGWLDPERLGVILGATARSTGPGTENVGEMVKKLGAQYVLQGSVRRDGEKVRVTAKLMEAKDQTQVWSNEYDRELSNLLVLQSEIAREIAGEIRLRLDERRKGTANVALSSKEVESHDLYLRGRYFWNKRTPEGFRRAADYFQQAVEKDPSYARAYSGLADCYTLMSSYAIEPARETMPKAKAASKKALELDERLAEAHTSAALVAEIYDWDWKTAEKEFRRAIELNPNYATAHHWYAESLAWQGRFDESFKEIEMARQLEPLSLSILADRGVFHYFARQYDEAISELREVVEMEPHFPRATILVFALMEKGEYAEALEAAKTHIDKNGSGWTESLQVYVNGRAGNKKAMEEALGELQREKRVTEYQWAIAELGTGNRERELAMLEKGLAEKSLSADVHVDPIFDPVREEPRFKKVMAAMGLE